MSSNEDYWAAGISPDRLGKSPLSEYMGKNVEGAAEEWVPQDAPHPEDEVDETAVELEKGFRTLTLDEVENLPDPEWLVKDFLPADSFATLVGAPASTKSFWALDVACCIAAGLPFNGHAVKEGNVLYFVGEGLRGFKWRVEAWRLAHPEANIEALYRNLRVVPDVPKVLDAQQVGMMVNTAKKIHETGTLRLFIIDTLARALVGGEENSAKDMGLAVDACETVRRRTGSTALVVHHTNKEGIQERGSTALRGQADTTLMVKHDDSTKITTLTVAKMKDWESGGVHEYILQGFGKSVVLAPHNKPGQDAYNKPAQDHYRQPFRAPLTKEDFVERARRRREEPF